MLRILQRNTFDARNIADHAIEIVGSFVFSAINFGWFLPKSLIIYIVILWKFDRFSVAIPLLENIWRYHRFKTVQFFGETLKIKRVLPTEVHSAVFEIDVNVMWSFTWVWSVIKTKADLRWISFGMIFKFFSFLP